MPRSKRYVVQADEHVSLQGSPLSPWSATEPSLHELHMANAEKLGPGRYRLGPPKIFSPAALVVDRLLKTSGQGSSAESDESHSTLAPDIAYVKLSAMAAKPSPRKRVYFNDVQQLEEPTAKKLVHDGKQLATKYQDPSLIVLSKPSKAGKSSENLVEHTEERPEMLMEPTIDVDTYEEVTVGEEYYDGAGATASPYLSSEGREIAGHTYRELKGENNYLKEQLQASMLRVKQLETLLLQRNGHVKKLVSENLQLSIKCRKLMSALGEDEIREAL
ncbi:hypothetical protein COOONC_10318 [Cooperia oncophora]